MLEQAQTDDEIHEIGSLMELFYLEAQAKWSWMFMVGINRTLEKAPHKSLKLVRYW